MGELVLQVFGKEQGSEHSSPKWEQQGEDALEDKGRSKTEATRTAVRPASRRSLIGTRFEWSCGKTLAEPITGLGGSAKESGRVE